MKKNKANKLVFLFSLLLAAGIYGWFYPLNKGTLELKTGLQELKVLIDGVESPCPADPCTTRLKSGLHELLIQKDDYTTLSQRFFIKRGKVTTIQADLERVFTLEPSVIVPKIQETPARPLPKRLRAISYTWNKNLTRLAFLDSEDERLKIQEPDNASRPVALLKNLDSSPLLHWSPDEETLVVQENQNLYWIKIKEGSRRKKELSFLPTALSFSPQSSLLLLNDGSKNLYQLSESERVETLGLAADLAQSAWINETTLLFFITDVEARRTDIKTLDPFLGQAVTLTVKFDFIGRRLSWDPENQMVYIQKDSGDWYEIGPFGL